MTRRYKVVNIEKEVNKDALKRVIRQSINRNGRCASLNHILQDLCLEDEDPETVAVYDSLEEAKAHQKRDPMLMGMSTHGITYYDLYTVMIESYEHDEDAYYDEESNWQTEWVMDFDEESLVNLADELGVNINPYYEEV